MKVVVQRSKHSSVSVDNKLINEIDKGLVILVGILDDDSGVMNKSILDVGGSILSISQFTLQAETKNGNRPSYINAMKGDDALKLYNLFNSKLKEYVETYPGVFGADMKVNILNDGPVTIIIDSKDK